MIYKKLVKRLYAELSVHRSFRCGIHQKEGTIEVALYGVPAYLLPPGG